MPRMGFRLFWQHETGIELRFEQGVLIGQQDVSAKVEIVRRKKVEELRIRDEKWSLESKGSLNLLRQKDVPLTYAHIVAKEAAEQAGKQALRELIRQTFELDYDFSEDE